MVDNSPPTTLRETLQSRNPSLFRETEAIIQHVTPLLGHSIATFPSGTSHTAEHTTTVEQIASLLVTPNVFRQLYDDEVQLLILACHFHDLGMAGTELDNQREVSREQARQDHAIRIGDRIREKWQSLGFRDAKLAELLSEVCRGHRPKRLGGKANWEEIRPHGIVRPNCEVRLRLLSALVYAADELHIGADRASVREQDWLQIENEESRRHWQRHQAINGPSLSNGMARFEVSVSTPVFENDIRKYVFRKACSAIHDANIQLSLDGVDGTLPPIAVEWLRDDMWRLLLLEVLCDQKARVDSEIVQAIRQRFDQESSEFEDLSGLSTDLSSNGERLNSSIERAVTDFRLGGYLVTSGESNAATLDIKRRSVREFFQIARDADDIDTLFAGRYASHHDFDLLRSEYGRAYADKYLVSLVERRFGVNLATEHEESPVLIVLRSSPTVGRLLTDYTPAPSVLVKRHPLRAIVLTGALLDLLRCPELILNKEFRHAIRHIMAIVGANQPQFSRFIEELALIGGYSCEQLHEAMTHSDSAKSEWNEAVPGGDSPGARSKVDLQIAQQVPTALPATAVSFPHLFMAGLRSAMPIELLNTPEAPLTITVNTSTQKDAPPTNPSKITIGPSQSSACGHISMRADIVTDKEVDVVEFCVKTLGEEGNRDLPLIIDLPVAALTKGGKAQTLFGAYSPALTAQHFQAIRNAVRSSTNDNIELNIVRAKDGQLFAAHQVARSQVEGLFPSKFSEELVEFLCSVGPETPLPWGVAEEELQVLADTQSDDRMQIYRMYAERDVKEKQQITSMILRWANSDGQDYREKYLGLFPNIRIGPPKIDETAALSQEELNRQWENPDKEMAIAASVSVDFHELACEFQEWAEDRTKPFPVNIEPGPPSSPAFKARFEIVNCPRIDRLWYVERPVLIRVRPLGPIERWEVEASYWQSVGDDDREEILRERIQEAKNAARATDKQPVSKSDPEQ